MGKRTSDRTDPQEYYEEERRDSIRVCIDEPIDQALDAIRETIREYKIGWYKAIRVYVRKLPETEAHLLLGALTYRRGLARYEADLAEVLAARLGRTLQWRHVNTAPGAAWEPGRGHYAATHDDKTDYRPVGTDGPPPDRRKRATAQSGHQSRMRFDDG